MDGGAAYGWQENESGVMELVTLENYWGDELDYEPEVLTRQTTYGSGNYSNTHDDHDALPENLNQAGFDTGNLENDLNSDGEVDVNDFKIELQQEFDNLVESVKKYKGFFVGRYETGNLSQEVAVVKKGNTDLGSQTWYKMYKVCKAMEKDNNEVNSYMIWGCQWDAMMKWMQTSSDSYVNTFPASDCYGKGNSKWKESTLIPAGSNKDYKIANIYDLAGNAEEFTMEAVIIGEDLQNRTTRGGSTTSMGEGGGVRFSEYTYRISYQLGCRAMMYILEQ